jgi:hypothetical protein
VQLRQRRDYTSNPETQEEIAARRVKADAAVSKLYANTPELAGAFADLGGPKLRPAQINSSAPVPPPITLDNSPVGPVPDDLLALRPEPDPEPEVDRLEIAKVAVTRLTDEEFEEFKKFFAEERAERALRGGSVRSQVVQQRTDSGEVFNLETRTKTIVFKTPVNLETRTKTIVFKTPEYLRGIRTAPQPEEPAPRTDRPAAERMEPPSVAHETSAGLNGGTATGEKEPG